MLVSIGKLFRVHQHWMAATELTKRPAGPGGPPPTGHRPGPPPHQPGHPSMNKGLGPKPQPPPGRGMQGPPPPGPPHGKPLTPGKSSATWNESSSPRARSSTRQRTPGYRCNRRQRWEKRSQKLLQKSSKVRLLSHWFMRYGSCVLDCWRISYSKHLEKTNEKQRMRQSPRKSMTLLRIPPCLKLWDISSNFRQDDDVEYALVEFQKLLVKFRDDVLALSYDGKNCTQMDEPGGTRVPMVFSRCSALRCYSHYYYW